MHDGQLSIPLYRVPGSHCCRHVDIITVVGRADSSGIRLTYSPTLRENDVGGMSIGNIEQIFVPPNSGDFRIVSYCHETCTQEVRSLNA